MSRDYWNRFPTPFTFQDEGDSIEGVVIAFGDKRDKYPQLHIRTADGKIRTLNITQARLHEKLGVLEPAEGDQIRITYKGPAQQAAPGMSPAKEFSVALQRKNGAKQ